MWLPQDERRLLAGYVAKIVKIGDEEWLDKKRDLGPLLKTRAQPEDMDKAMRIDAANNLLVNRGLIVTQPDDVTKTQVAVTLTTEGQLWGKRYQTFAGRADAFYLEYKNRILGVLAGIVLTLILAVLTRWLTK